LLKEATYIAGGKKWQGKIKQKEKVALSRLESARE